MLYDVKYRRDGVEMVVVCASDETVHSFVWGSVVRRAWVLCVVLAAKNTHVQQVEDVSEYAIACAQPCLVQCT